MCPYNITGFPKILIGSSLISATMTTFEKIKAEQLDNVKQLPNSDTYWTNNTAGIGMGREITSNRVIREILCKVIYQTFQGINMTHKKGILAALKDFILWMMKHLIYFREIVGILNFHTISDTYFNIKKKPCPQLNLWYSKFWIRAAIKFITMNFICVVEFKIWQ